MEQVEEAQHELDRIQGIITRHEGFLFTIRGWLITVVGGLLIAYYTDNIVMSDLAMKIALVSVTFLFWIVESQHINLIESVVERAEVIEKQIASWRQPGVEPARYDGPRVCEACEKGVKRWRPINKMTLQLNLRFYFVVAAIIIVVSVWLPPKA